MDSNRDSRVILDLRQRELLLLRVALMALRRDLYKKNARSSGDRLSDQRRGWMREMNVLEDRLKECLRDLEQLQE